MTLQNEQNLKLNASSACYDFRMPAKLRFGIDSFQAINEEVLAVDTQKIVIISDKGLEKVGLVDKLIEQLEGLSIPIKVFTEIMGEPTFDTVRAAVKFIEQEKGDLVIGIGGGSALDVAKAAAALSYKQEISSYLDGTEMVQSRQVHCILLPTTSGTGSEVTMNAIFGDESSELKRGIVSPYFLPDVAIIDPALTLSCPAKVTAASGVDAFTHALESYVAVKATPLTKIYAEKAMKLFANNITKAVFQGNNLEARVNMSWLSMMAGVSLANAGVGAVHALAYPLGGKFHIEHGVANALLMPYVFAVTGKTCMEQMVEVANFLHLGDYSKKPQQALSSVVNYLYKLLDELELPTSLQELGIDESALPILASQAAKIDRLLSNTPYQLKEAKILEIYQNAHKGFKHQ